MDTVRNDDARSTDHPTYPTTGSTDDGGCPTILIDDEPAAEDELVPPGQLGPHTRVARAMADLIRSNEKGGKVIGVEGGWGAGKTTVIRLFRAQINGESSISVAVFDAWAHRGDPLRRTFLESLVVHLRSSGWLPEKLYEGDDGWEAKVDALAKRRRQSTTTLVPRTTPLATWFAISAFLVPVGAALLGGSVSKGVTIDASRPIMWPFVLGLPFAFAPLAVAAVHWLRARLKGRKPDWNLIVGKSTVTQQTTETDTPDPTSLEFESFFGQLTQDVLSRDRDRKLVIVVDNLDRVEPADALAIWSTLQTFLGFNVVPDREWMGRLWLVVPYDPNGLRALWHAAERGAGPEGGAGKRRAIIGVRPPQAGEAATGTNDVEAGESNDRRPSRLDRSFESEGTRNRSTPESAVAESFIDKSFQVRFEVPPPVFSNWRTYLKRLVALALPKHESDADQLCRLYSFVRPNYHPTPRELKLFVNQIGMIHRQWPDHPFPLAHIAYYVLLRRTGFDAVDAVLDLPHQGVERVAGGTDHPLQESLAGLAFNVEPRLGMELVLKERILSAFRSGQPKQIDDLAARAPRGFWALVPDVADDGLSEIEAVHLGPAIRSTTACEAFKAADRRSQSKIVFDQLVQHASAPELVWPSVDAETGGALGELAAIGGHPDVTSRLADSIRRTGTTGEAPSTLDRTQLVEGIAAFVRRVESLGHDAALAEPFPVPATAEQWIGMAPTLLGLAREGDREPIWSRLKPAGTSPAEIVDAFSKAVTEGAVGSDLLTSIRVSREAATGLDLQPLVRSCREWLDFSKNNNGPQVGHVLDILFDLRDAGSTAIIKELVDQGHILHAFNHKATRRDDGAAVRCLAAVVLARPGLDQPPQPAGSQSDSGYQHLQTFLQQSGDKAHALAKILVAVLTTVDLGALFQALAQRPTIEPLLGEALKVLVDDDDLCPTIPFDFARDRWPAIRGLLSEGDRRAKLLKCLIASGQLAAAIESSSLGGDRADFYTELLGVGTEPAFVVWCAEQVRAIDKNGWAAALRQNPSLLDLCATLRRVETTFRMPHTYTDAVMELAKEHMDPSSTQPEWRVDVLELLDPGQTEDFQVQCASAMIHHGDRISQQFYERFGPKMTVPERFRGDAPVSTYFQRMVTTRDPYGLRWLADLLRRDPTLVDSASSGVAGVFRDRLREAIESRIDDEAEGPLKTIASILDVRIPVVGVEETPAEAESGTSEE